MTSFEGHRKKEKTLSEDKTLQEKKFTNFNSIPMSSLLYPVLYK